MRIRLHPCALPAAVVATLTLGAGLPARAESLGSAASSASSAGSQSVGSLSDSIQGSSNSSSGKRNVAQGDYRVIEVADADRPGLLQLRLRPVADAATADDDVVLRLPRQALGPEGMATGALVRVAHRPYGLAFARVGDQGAAAPFFLALDDAWQRELTARPVSL